MPISFDDSAFNNSLILSIVSRWVSGIIDTTASSLSIFQNVHHYKVGCAFPMVISSDFWMGKHRDDVLEEGAPYFRKYIYVWNPRTEPKVSIVVFWVGKCHKIAQSTKMSEMAYNFSVIFGLSGYHSLTLLYFNFTENFWHFTNSFLENFWQKTFVWHFCFLQESRNNLRTFYL